MWLGTKQSCCVLSSYIFVIVLHHRLPSSLHLSSSVARTSTSFFLHPLLLLLLPLFPFISPYPSISLVHIYQSPTTPLFHHTNLPFSLSLSLSLSQVTPARPLIRILSLSKCIVTGGWQPCVCVCVSMRVWVCDSLGSLLAVTMAAAWHF